MIQLKELFYLNFFSSFLLIIFFKIINKNEEKKFK